MCYLEVPCGDPRLNRVGVRGCVHTCMHQFMGTNCQGSKLCSGIWRRVVIRGSFTSDDCLWILSGTPLKPPLHALHAYDSLWLNPKFALPDAMRTMLLHKRQMHETARQEQRAAEKAAELADHAGYSTHGVHALLDPTSLCAVTRWTVPGTSYLSCTLPGSTGNPRTTVCLTAALSQLQEELCDCSAACRGALGQRA